MKWVAVFLGVVVLLGSAAARGGAGLYAGWPEVFGIHFVTPDGWRVSVGLAPEGGEQRRYSVAVSLDLILASGTVYSDSKTADLTYYAGAGASGSLLRANPEVNGHALLGLEAFFADMKSAGIFAELQLGQRIIFIPLTTEPFLGFRVGLTLR